MKSRQRLHPLEAHSSYPAALKIIERLRAGGATAVFAGGSVRDSLLGRTPKDLDIATSAAPDVVEAAFPNTLAVGKAFGTIVVMEEGYNFEVTTFRREGPYLDGRHPSAVSFTEIEEDSHRRDFTVNALFYDPIDQTVLDFVGGQKDLAAKRLRTVGDPRERFHEDRLRMLRAIRFVGQLGFALDRESVEAIKELAPQLKSVSAERVLNEVKRLLMAPHLVEALETLKPTGLAAHFWPEAALVESTKLKAFPIFNSWENAFAALMWLAKSEAIEERLRGWKASRDSLRSVTEQLAAVRVLLDPKSRKASRIRAFGGSVYADLLVLATGILTLENRRADLEKWIAEYLEVAGLDGSLPPALVTGQDLIALGVAPGAEMGEMIKQAYELQLEGEVRTKAEALARIHRA